jgi:hypothetical protein
MAPVLAGLLLSTDLHDCLCARHVGDQRALTSDEPRSWCELDCELASKYALVLIMRCAYTLRQLRCLVALTLCLRCLRHRTVQRVYCLRCGPSKDTVSREGRLSVHPPASAPVMIRDMTLQHVVMQVVSCPCAQGTSAPAARVNRAGLTNGECMYR